ncbi:hypothetical protein [Pseudorhodobacter sp.]|uniref:hypothetical protein n=1 Tax=Pseudorhodobacter sp. TaxID=1934400 RepID=UPI0026489252|nr:hypothetical protein [Pseudorhodobacter sp.]MDN5787558.1 hypothetical protein [Pseudorhodobacter sp.]
MKQLLAACLLLLTALPVLAEPADMNLYIMLWPEGDADEPKAAQMIEIDAGQIHVFTSENLETEQDKSTPADPARVALVSAAIQAVFGTISMDAVPEQTGDTIAVEWSVGNAATFARGTTTFPITALPSAILAVQDEIFGARLTP